MTFVDAGGYSEQARFQPRPPSPSRPGDVGAAGGAGVTADADHVHDRTGEPRHYGGSGAPASTLGSNGSFYFRTDTPGTANQRIYVKSAGAWVGIV